MLHDLRRLLGPSPAERALRAEMRQIQSDRALALDLLRRLLDDEQGARDEARRWLASRGGSRG